MNGYWRDIIVVRGGSVFVDFVETTYIHNLTSSLTWYWHLYMKKLFSYRTIYPQYYIGPHKLPVKWFHMNDWKQIIQGVFSLSSVGIEPPDMQREKEGIMALQSLEVTVDHSVSVQSGVSNSQHASVLHVKLCTCICISTRLYIQIYLSDFSGWPFLYSAVQ